jgi:predicted double-glycine peptidase
VARRPRGRLPLVLSTLALASACAGPLQSEEVYVHDDATVVPASGLIPVPLVRQDRPYSCGDAVVLALLRFYEPERYAKVSEARLYAPLRTTSEEGTEPGPIVAYLGLEPGLSAEARWSTPSSYVTLDELERAIDRGEPAIVALQAWQSVAKVTSLRDWATDWDDGHYVVVIAYDAANLYFMDPSTESHYAYIPLAEFMDRWHDIVGPAKVHTEHIAIFVHSASGARGASRLELQRTTAIH